MLVGICGQLLDAGQDLRQNGINLVILTKVITELWKEKRRKKEKRWWRKKGRDGEGKKGMENGGRGEKQKEGRRKKWGKEREGTRRRKEEVRLASSRGILTHSHTNTLSSPYL